MAERKWAMPVHVLFDSRRAVGIQGEERNPYYRVPVADATSDDPKPDLDWLRAQIKRTIEQRVQGDVFVMLAESTSNTLIGMVAIDGHPRSTFGCLRGWFVKA